MGFSWAPDDPSLGAGFARIFAEQVERAIATIDDGGLSPGRRIHAVRRRAKRLRGLLRLVRPGFKAYKVTNAAIRDAARELSGTRDAAVLRETLIGLCNWSGHPLPPLDAAPVDPEAELAALGHMRQSLDQVLAQSAQWNTGRIDAEAVAEGCALGYRAARKALAACRQTPSDEHFHEWRKHVKYHGFHLLLLRRCLPDSSSDVDHLEHLATLLGRHHDLAVLAHALEHDPDGLAPGLDATDLVHQARLRRQRLADHVFRIGGPLFVRRPSDIRQSVLSRWQDWRGETGSAA